MRSYRDPENRVLIREQQVYRVASGESAQDLKKFMVSDLCENLQQTGWLPRFSPCNPADSELLLKDFDELELQSNSSAMVLQVESVAPITFPWEWGAQDLFAAGVFLLDVRQRLLKIGFDLKDASAHNVAFINGKPMLIDLGSIVSWKGTPHWIGLRQFTEHFINPLLASKKGQLSISDFWRISPLSGLTSKAARKMMRLFDRYSPRTVLIQKVASPPRKDPTNDITRLSDANQATAIKISLTQTQNLRKLLERGMRQRTDPHSTWRNYGTRDHYSEEELTKKLMYALNFAQHPEIQGSRIIDFGGNDGLVAQFVSSKCQVEVVVVDDDLSTVEGISKRTNRNSAVHYVRADMMGASNALRVGPADFDSLVSRIKPAGIFCHAVIHHVVISQAVPLRSVVSHLRGIGLPVQVEFVDENDPKVLQLISRIDNWKGDYSKDSFMKLCKTMFSSVEIAGQTTSHRFVVNLIP